MQLSHRLKVLQLALAVVAVAAGTWPLVSAGPLLVLDAVEGPLLELVPVESPLLELVPEEGPLLELVPVEGPLLELDEAPAGLEKDFVKSVIVIAS